MSVQANGGLHSSGNHRIYIDWGGDSKFHGTVDSTDVGEFFTTQNPPAAAQIGAVPMSGGTLNEEASLSVISSVKDGASGQALYGPLFRSCMKDRGGDGDFKDGGSVAFRIVEVVSNYAFAEILFDGYGSIRSFQFRNDGTIRAPGSVYAGEAYIPPDGNVYGSVWGGYLSNYIAGQIGNVEAWTNNQISSQVGTAQTWVSQNFVNSSRQASATWSGKVGGGAGLQVPAGCVVISARNNGSSDVANMSLLYAAQQILVNGNWMTIGLA